jgi:hypothetical protein
VTAPAPSPAEQSVIDRFGIFAEERVIEEVARAIYEAEMPHTTWTIQAPHLRRIAAAAVAAYRATQDGGAEEAVRRVEALAEELQREGEREEAQAKKLGASVTAESWWGSAAASLDAAARIRAALAPQADR